MSIDGMRFKPGVLNAKASSANNKSDLTAKKAGEGGAAAVNKQTASNSTSNIFGRTVASGSILKSQNSGQTVSPKGASGGTASSSAMSSNGSIYSRNVNKNYVSSGYANNQADYRDMKKDIYTGNQDYGASRGYGINGGTQRSGNRAWQKMEDYDRYAYSQLHPQVEKSTLQKISDVTTGIAGAVGAIAGAVDLGKTVAGLFSKGSKTGGGSGNNSTGGAAAAQQQGQAQVQAASAQTSASVQQMQDADTSQELDGAINGAQQELQSMDGSIDTAKANKAEAKAKQSSLKTVAKKEAKEAKEAQKDVKTHQSKASKFKEDAAKAKGTMEGKQAQIDKKDADIKKNNDQITQNDNKVQENTTTINSNKQTISSNRSKISNLDSQIASAEASNTNGANSATIASLKQQKAQLEQANQKLEKEIADLEKQNDDLNKQTNQLKEQNTKLSEEKSKLETERDEAKEQMEKAQKAADEETKLADEAKTTAAKEEQEAKDAERAVADNEAAIAAATETVDGLKAQQTTLKSAISEQQDRYKTLKKDEIKQEQAKKGEQAS
ncbi:hypothetical protein IKP85_05130 [bacterium]|nr:hypothetical protein [bacterium]